MTAVEREMKASMPSFGSRRHQETVPECERAVSFLGLESVPPWERYVGKAVFRELE